MFGDETEKKQQTHEIGAPLDSLSVGELEARIVQLEAEIARLKTAISAKGISRAAAEAAFKF